MRLLSAILLIPAIFHVTASQTREPDIKFRLAQSYEQSGDFESAVKLYEQVLAKDSTSFLVIDALHRGYIQLKRYDAAIDLVLRVVQRAPNDILWLSRLGSLYNLKAEDAKATAVWNRAIAVDPGHESTYRAVASSMIESRLFERAIDVFLRGRTACNAPGLFTNDLAYLYAITLNYSAATREYLGVLRQNPDQLSYVQSRIASYIVRPDGLKAATSVVDDAATSEPANSLVQQLLAWLYMESKRYDRAYEVYKLLDATLNAGGHEIFAFAERAFRDRGYAAAGIAYRDIMTRFPKFDQIAQVKFGNARTLEELAVQSDTSNPPIALAGSRVIPAPVSESGALYTSVITAYHLVIAEFPKTDFAARALFRIAVLKLERFYDLDGALGAIESLEKSAPSPTLLLDATLRKGDISLAKGDLSGAEAIYLTLTGQQPIIGDQRERAAFRLAELLYYQGRFSDALSRLEKLTRNAGSDITNDALKLQIFIQENATKDEAALKEFAKGELLVYRRKYSEALTVFQSIPKASSSSPLLDEAIMNIGSIEVALRRYSDAIRSLERLEQEDPESVLLDAALMNTGAVYEIGLHDRQKAIDAYQQLLKRYPNSLYVNEARKRIRELRGDIL